MHRITVIGAANVDIATKSRAGIIHGDSNPAEISLSPGGVARNIAENLSLLGAKVRFITAIGGDPLGGFLRERCEECGINTDKWIMRDGISTGVYLAALNCDGELYAGFNAMAVIESITPGDLAPLSGIIKSADLLVADANLAEETLIAIVKTRDGRPVMIDAASAVKAPRIKSVLSEISILKLNRAEAECLTGFALETDNDLRRACADLTSRGANRVFITLGGSGACAADRDDFHFIPAIPVPVKNVTGAGDAFAAGVAEYFHESLIAQAKHGIELAAGHLIKK